MSCEIRGATPYLDIEDELFSNPRRFSFIQVIRILRILLSPEDNLSSALMKKIEVEPLLSLAFPGTDVVKIEKREEKVGVIATFLGLYGPSSPLPVYYTEELIAEYLEEKRVKRDFFNIFNRPFFKLFVEVWCKYRLWIRLFDEKDEEGINFLFSFLGIDWRTQEEEKRELGELLAYAPLFSIRPRSALGLKGIISDFFEEDRVRVEECVPESSPIPREQRSSLGMVNSILGEDIFVGEEIVTLNLSVRIVVGPREKEKFFDIVPDSPAYNRLRRIVSLYLNQPIRCLLHLLVRPEDVEPISLGSKWSQVGISTWLYSKNYTGILSTNWIL